MDALQNIKIFLHKDTYYLANLCTLEVKPISSQSAHALSVSSKEGSPNFQELLSECPSTERDEILRLFDEMADRADMLFLTSSNMRLKLFITASYERAWSSGSGALIANVELNKALSNYADLYFLHDPNESLDKRYYTIKINPNDLRSIIQMQHYGFDGFLLPHVSDFWFTRYIRYANAPVLIPIHAFSGHNGMETNQALVWYSLMRDFDVFYVAAEVVREHYCKMLMDKDRFHLIYNGVDPEVFYPMDKTDAKKQVAELINELRILDRPIVGFLSRFQPEKGATIFLKLAYMNPDLIFLAVAPNMDFYNRRKLPPNFIYSGKQPRERLPLFFNAFDIHCFPSMSAEEICPLSLLESMACGLPIIATNFTGVKEIINDGAILVEPLSEYRIGTFAADVHAEDFSNAINTLLSDKDKCIEIGLSARRRATAFTWDHSAKQIIQLINKLKKEQQIVESFPEPHLAISFTRASNGVGARLVSYTDFHERILSLGHYDLSIAEGIALSLLRKHSPREVEFVLKTICADSREAERILLGCVGLINAIS